MQLALIGLFALTLIVLKLAGVIAWHWFVVLSPVWILAIVLAGAIYVLAQRDPAEHWLN